MYVVLAVLADFSLAGEPVRTEGNFLSSHCIDCHGEDGEADIDLRQLIQGQEESLELIELVHHVIDLHEMPPEEMDQPSKKARVRVADDLQHLLVKKDTTK